MYQLIYDFLREHLFNGLALDNMTSSVLGQSMSLNEWLCHSLTIVSLVLIFVFIIIFVKWLFKVISGLFLLR